ncbi:AMP-binding protein [Rhizobacter sp. Root1221]|uniref:AMP-binding protein n=1 Tax=Rhizobacter sp. Root1221 TaxID=1736433 RepID=UPI0006F85638|nr:AMP-binding protein [Rhizobacter sp. Root1221]KQV99482.1 hypothetical protein ASC87_20655 [Rhizobacter sp. Root1221]
MSVPSIPSLIHRLQDTAAEHPQRPALVGDDARFSYAALLVHCTAIAHGLQHQGIGRGDVVVVCMPRGAGLVAAALGVLGSGAAYTLLEDDGAEPQLAARMRGLQPAPVIALPARAAGLMAQGIAAFTPDVLAAAGRAPDALPASGGLAYVSYTSGSTGGPKGVAVTHDNIAHYTESAAARLQVEPGWSYAHVSTFNADLGHTAIFLALWTGGTLHVASDGLRQDPAALCAYLVDQRIDLLKITPSHWRAVLAAGRAWPHALKRLVLGGERLAPELVRHSFAAGAAEQVANHYGPTETTVGVAIHPMKPHDLASHEGRASVPVGRAIGCTRFAVETAPGRFGECDCTGELYIGGPSVAQGYLGDGERTAERFVHIEGQPGRFYRTGDLVRIDAQGCVECLGRIDRQVKLMGHRVELEEVELALQGFDGVAAAAVALYPVNGHDQLVALSAPRWPAERVKALRQLARERLPSHMVPAHWFTCDALPLDANGKVHHRAVRERVVEALALVPQADAALRPLTPLEAEIHAAWCEHLGGGAYDPDTDFFEAGGDSLSAMQIIAALQLRGHPLTARLFEQHRSITSLAAVIERLDSVPAARALPEVPPSQGRLSPAQAWFFAQAFDAPDHWNQCLVLESAVPVDVARLARAVGRVLAEHPMLRTGYRREASDIVPFEVNVQHLPLPLSHGSDVQADEAHVQRAVAERCAVLNAAISIERGEVFKLHCAAFGARRWVLVLVAHHLCIDAVSWRIVVDDLVRHHADDAAPMPRTCSFWQWTAHLHERLPEAWHRAVRPSAVAPGSRREGQARTLWCELFSGEVPEAVAQACSRHEAHLGTVLLGSFAHACAAQAGQRTVGIDVESHGRECLRDEVDVSRVVGWFTSTFALSLLADASDAGVAIASAAAAMGRVRHLGHGHEPTAATGTPRLCFNFIGDIGLRHDPALPLSVSPLAPAPARGPSNRRPYDLVLTVKRAGASWVAELCHSVDRYRDDEVKAIALRLLAALHGQAPVREPLCHAAPLAAGGLLAHVPPTLLQATVPSQAQGGAYDCILLTGATGFIGAHVLAELLQQTTAQIHCLVRGRPGRPAAERLADALRRVSPALAALLRGRVTVLDGDVSLPRFGLSADQYGRLVAQADAIYHFAADVRLFGEAGHFERHNVAGVEHVIALAGAGRAKDIHCMSTLAVAGVAPPGPPWRFDEHCLDGGQQFQNPYEASKYRAELRLRRHAAEAPRRVSIYRSGNVTGHSQTGQFQCNASDNQLVQLLRGIVALGRYPRHTQEGVVLSPVDVVARGIVEISLSPGRGGTFHVDNSQPTPYAQVFEAMRELGLPLQPHESPTLLALLSSATDAGQRDAALALSWAARPPRNVAYDHARSTALLAGLGVRFPAIGRAWLHQFVAHLIEARALAPAPSELSPAAS